MFVCLFLKAENEKLSAELHASVDQNTQMYEKVLVVSVKEKFNYTRVRVINACHARSLAEGGLPLPHPFHVEMMTLTLFHFLG